MIRNSCFLKVFIGFVLFFALSSFDEQETQEDQAILSLIKDSRNTKYEYSLRLEKLNDAYALIQEMNSGSLKISYLSETSKAYYALKKEKLFLKVNRQAWRHAIDHNDSVQIANSCRNFGVYYRDKKQNDSAYYYFFEASKIYNKTENKVLEGKVLLGMAIIQKNIKDYIGGEVTTVKALRCLEGTKEYFSLFSLYNNLGMISDEFGRYDDAVENYNLAYEYAKKVKNSSSGEVISLNNLGLAYEKQQKYQEAIQYYEKALTYKTVLGRNPGFYAVILDNIANAKFRSGDTEELPELFYKPLRICDSINDTSGKIFINLHLSEYYQSISQLDSAKKHALEAKSLSESQDANRDLLKSLLLLSEISEANEGVSYARQYIHLSDSLLKQARATRNQFARIRFETDVIEEQKEKVTKQRAWLLWGIVVLLLVFGLLFVIFKQQQYNNELRYAQEQQKANEEIYQLMLSQQVKLEEGRQMEKRRISEELHDGVLGRLFGTRLGLDGLNQRQTDDLAYERSKYIVELSSIEKEIRRISHDLSSNTFISEVAFVEVVEKLIIEHCKVHKLNYKFEDDPAIEWDEITDNVKINLYRIIQESLQNIAKHAKAENIQIRFDMVPNRIKITIFDDGIGFKNQKLRKGIGLKNITSRTREIKGDVTFENRKNQGAMVVITLPAVA